MKLKYFNMIQYITDLIHIRSTGITTFETRTGTPIFTNKDGYNHFTTNKDGYANFIDNKNGYADFRNKDGYNHFGDKAGYAENKGEEMEDEKIVKLLQQGYLRELVCAKAYFAKKQGISLKVKNNLLVASESENGNIGGMADCAYEPAENYFEFKKKFLRDLRDTKFLTTRMTKEKLWREYEKIVDDYKDSCPCCENILYDVANLIEEIIEEGVEPENENE